MASLSRSLVNIALINARYHFKPQIVRKVFQNKISTQLFVQAKSVTSYAREWIDVESRPQYSLDKPAFDAARQDEKTYLIDVREPIELDDGKVEAANCINIPLGFLWEAFLMSPEEFKEKYGLRKPSEDDKIVFMCLAGVRSTWALQIGQYMGYKNSQHYIGGYYEWTTDELFPL